MMKTILTKSLGCTICPIYASDKFVFPQMTQLVKGDKTDPANLTGDVFYESKCPAQNEAFSDVK